jgi:acetoin utilization protein AcuB
MLVGKRMTKDPKTVGPEDSLAQAAAIMRQFRINHLPVVEENRLVGILSDTDLRNAALGSGRRAGDVRDRKVKDAMKTEVWSLTPEDSLEDALLVITRKRFGALPVLSGDRLVGILTKVDLLAAFADVLKLDDVCSGIEVSFPKSLSRFEELISALAGMGTSVRSCIITPDNESGRMNARLRLDTLDTAGIRVALREKRFVVLESPSPL